MCKEPHVASGKVLDEFFWLLDIGSPKVSAVLLEPVEAVCED